MKRYMVLGGIAVLLVLLVICTRRASDSGTPDVSEQPSQALKNESSGEQPNVARIEPQPATKDVTAAAGPATEREYQAKIEDAIRRSSEAGNIPVSFYGQVVDQDTNPLPDVTVDLAVIEEHVDLNFQVATKTTRLQKQTGADGRFEVSGGQGKYVSIYPLTKKGYEQDFPEQAYGKYGVQNGTPSEPVVFRMWSTNLHEPLVTGGKSFVITPDGRHYAIDLFKGTINEGDEGDLIVWIKRPLSATWGQRYDWSCEVAVVGGGLLESDGRAMFTAPESGYTNAFRCQEQANPYRWSDGTGEKRFYVQLRNSKIYGRIAVDLYANYHGKQPAMIQLSYAINPSGSRLLR